MKIIEGIIFFVIAIMAERFIYSPPATAPTPTTTIVRDFYPPLTPAADRVTKKTFGMYITPLNSPVQPEKFTGYHTGTDFEIFPDESDRPVTVNAICTGKLLIKEYASGYGGVAVQACQLNGQPITVIYGHLKLASINWNKGNMIETNNPLGILGANKSMETDRERKHLHLGIHLGTEINIRGYVSSAEQLGGWINPCVLVCK